MVPFGLTITRRPLICRVPKYRTLTLKTDQMSTYAFTFPGGLRNETYLEGGPCLRRTVRASSLRAKTRCMAQGPQAPKLRMSKPKRGNDGLARVHSKQGCLDHFEGFWFARPCLGPGFETATFGCFLGTSVGLGLVSPCRLLSAGDPLPSLAPALTSPEASRLGLICTISGVKSNELRCELLADFPRYPKLPVNP